MYSVGPEWKSCVPTLLGRGDKQPLELGFKASGTTDSGDKK